MRGQEILNNPFLNKGTGFTEEERAELGLTGLLPAHVQTIKEQADQAYAQYLKKLTTLKSVFSFQHCSTQTVLCSITW